MVLRCTVLLFLMLLLGCGGTDLGESLAIQGSVNQPVPQTETPTVISTTPVSPALSNQPRVNGTSEPNSEVRVFSDSLCTVFAGSGLANEQGVYSVEISEALIGGSEQAYWVQATAPEKSESDCSTSSVTYRTTAIGSGLAWLQGNLTTAPFSPSQVNQAIAYPLSWNQSEFDSNFFDHSTESQSEKLIIKQAGDYWVAATLPLEMLAGTYRPCVRLEIRVNGALVSGAIGQSSYIRFDGPTGNSQSSSHVAMLLRNLSVDDEIEVLLSETAGQDGSEIVSINSVASLLLEYVTPTRELFTASTTRTVADTNINGALSSFEWTQGRIDSGFVHDNGLNPQNIQLSAGTYLAFINIPVTSASTRTSPRVQLRLNGGVINGGQASQGYIRDDSGHNDSSIHWSGYFVANDNDILTVTSEREAGGGTVNIQPGQVGNLNLERLSSSQGVIALRGTQLVSGVDWNGVVASPVQWTQSDIHDTDLFTHSTLLNSHQILINQFGDYLLTYNDSMAGSNDRVSPIIKVQVNGVDVSGAESKTHYMRNTSGHDESSASLVFLLRNLSPNDIVTVTSQRDVGAGPVTPIEDAILMIIKK